MKCRKQKTVRNTDYPVESSMEGEGRQGELNFNSSENTDGNSVVGCEPVRDLLKEIIGTENLMKAYERVVRNGGAAGIDGMTVRELQPYLVEHGRELVASIKGGWYKPKPVRRVEIPKPDGGVRLLGVPTVVDRMVQQAIVQVLQPEFETTFSDSSYGFRPGRSAHQAIRKAEGYYKDGYKFVVDLDLEKYFDTVNHEILLNMIRETIKDERVIRLIRRFLKSGVMIEGLVSQTEKGTPQGGNLSPLLSNIYLTKFDRLLEERGHKFVRYADDCNIYVKSLKAAERVMEGCVKYLEGKLKLKVNRKKSAVGSPKELKFLGFSLYEINGRSGIRVHEKPQSRFKERLKEITSRKRTGSEERIFEELRRLITGWLGYYRLADMKKYLIGIEQWLRRRIRQLFWKRWKKTGGRFINLMKLGIDRHNAWMWANTRKSYWRTAGSFILTKSLTNEYLDKIGFPKIVEQYRILHASH